MLLAALIAALVIAAGLTGGLVWTVKKLTDAHAGERAARADQATEHREHDELREHNAQIVRTLEEFRRANETLAHANEEQQRRLTLEREGRLRAEKHRDELIQSLAAHQDPTALVHAINDELAAFTRR